MIKLFSEEEFKDAKSTDFLPLKCQYCGNVFYRQKKEIKYAEKLKSKSRCCFCCQACGVRYAKETIVYKCDNCGKEFFLQHRFNKNKDKNHFCSKSCAATYNNRHKKHGTRTSKLEKFLAIKLIEQYPCLRFLLNDKETIGSELDFYIPSLKLAFEINGIFHYEPIYGEEKLKKTKENDEKKKEACDSLGIDLCVIDVSSQKYFKEETSKKFLNEMASKINQKLETQ